MCQQEETCFFTAHISRPRVSRVQFLEVQKVAKKGWPMQGNTIINNIMKDGITKAKRKR